MKRPRTLAQRDPNSRIRSVILPVCLALLVLSTHSRGANSANRGQSCRTLRAIARVQMAFGDYAKARPLMEQALHLARTQNADDSELSLCLIDFAWLNMQEGRLTTAEEMCTAALRLQEQLYGKNHPYAAYTLRILGSIHRERGEYREAASVLEKAVEIMQEYHRPDDMFIAPFKIEFAETLADCGDFEQANALCDKALPIIEAGYGPGHLYTAGVYVSVASLLTRQGRYAEAELLVNKAIDIRQRICGENLRQMVLMWLTQAKICQAKQEFDEAEELIRRALDAIEKKYGPGHLLAGKALGVLAELYAAQGREIEAKAVCKRAIEVLGKLSMNRGQN